ncbi:hypothetical protein WJX84_010376 [Apatococcus fuscideae]|uniref:Uncharacterized protein n=1 Tax=Apatococcus fuscideae TaxID=2026836 RepID=A0AAW1SYE2_9CHLO
MLATLEVDRSVTPREIDLTLLTVSAEECPGKGVDRIVTAWGELRSLGFAASGPTEGPGSGRTSTAPEMTEPAKPEPRSLISAAPHLTVAHQPHAWEESVELCEADLEPLSEPGGAQRLDSSDLGHPCKLEEDTGTTKSKQNVQEKNRRAQQRFRARQKASSPLPDWASVVDW